MIKYFIAKLKALKIHPHTGQNSNHLVQQLKFLTELCVLINSGSIPAGLQKKMHSPEKVLSHRN
ncbi:hypothetical protein JN11_00709 [Mucilaginibacter frigoritolerans]|jgi:hypothetical protein|uniref:Uncharacterized protein n=1 Tax=Mucilaginibacter frigoritolerans TaxID=652788 RepID=A0A562UBL1_9SPHI|nr:hypothetical protein JN11_00709 [Mucilaginibacter frigoritolerans]